MPHSHHSHSGQFCRHATGTLDSVVLAAITRSFEVYGLTEHVPRLRNRDLYPEERELTPTELATQFSQFVEEANHLKDKYASKISLLVGAETENITPSDLDALDTLLKTHSGRIDYLVGSVHHVNEIPIDFDFETYKKSLYHGQWATEHEAQENFLCKYFDAQFALLDRFHPEVVGHFDLCRLYNPHLRFSDFPAAWERMERNILYVVRYGGLFELNSAAFKKGWNTAYPGEDVVSVRPLLNVITTINQPKLKQLILKHNGHFVLSDDAHGPHAVGLNYHQLARYLDNLNITELWYLRPSSTPNSAGRMIERVKLEGDWRNSASFSDRPDH